jgi:hypothetical protein
MTMNTSEIRKQSTPSLKSAGTTWQSRMNSAWFQTKQHSTMSPSFNPDLFMGTWLHQATQRAGMLLSLRTGLVAALLALVMVGAASAQPVRVSWDGNVNPTTLDSDGNNINDWIVREGGSFNTANLATLGDGTTIWRGGQTLDTRPRDSFSGTTTVYLRWRLTGPVAVDRQFDGGFWINFIPLGGEVNMGLVYTYLTRSGNTTTVNVATRAASTGAPVNTPCRSPVSVDCFPEGALTTGTTITGDDFIDTKLVFNTGGATPTVQVFINGTDIGTRTIPIFSNLNNTNDNWATILGNTNVFELDYICINSLNCTPPTQLGITTQPSASAANGAAFAQQPVIQLRDASGYAVSQSGVVVTAAIASGGGTLGGTLTATTDAFGVATFTNLAITGIVGERTLTFTAPNLTSVTSNSINITAGAATQLALTTPAAGASCGAAFTTQPAIQLRDVSGNAVSQSGVEVTMSASSGATVVGTATATTNASGVATFSDVGIDGISGPAFTLTFAANGLTSATQIIPFDACIYLGGPGKGDDTDATGLVDLLGTPYYQWLGGATDNQTDWFTTTNWNPDIVPGSDIGVYIGPSANQPRISGTSPGADVLREKPTLIQDNATLTLEAGPLLTLGESSTTTTSGTGRIVLEPGARYLNLSSSEPLLRVQQRLAGGTEPGTGIKGWRMVGAPVATSFHSMFDGLVLQGFAGSDFPDLQANLLWWDETDRGTTLQHWRQPGNRNEMIPPGRGHFHYVFNGAGRLNTDGSPSGQNYTDILPKSIAVDGVDSLFARATEFSFPVTFSARDSISSSGGGVSSPDTLYLEINQANAGWNLMANPTPSFLDWGASSGWTRTGIGPTIYVWDPAANSGNGDYLIWNQDSNTGTLHGGGGGGSGILAPYQAFWVQATCEGESCPEPLLSMSRQALTSSSAPFLRKSDALEKTQANGTNYSTGGTSAGRSTGNTGTAAGSGRDSRGTIDASDRVMQRVASASDNASAMSIESHATPEKAVLTLRVQQQELSTSALMVFTPEGSVGYDPSDAPRLMPMNDTWIAVYTRHPIANAAPLHLNHLPYYPGESQWSVDLEVAAYRQGMPVDDEFELSWELSEGWPDHLRVYLVDQRMRTLVPLSRTETYSFTHQTTLGVLARGLITNSVDRGGDNGRAGHSATKLPPVDATHGEHSPGGASQDGRSELRNGFQDDITQHNWLSDWSIHPRYPTTVSGGPGAVLPPGPVLGTVPGALNHGAMGRTLPGVNSKDTASRFQILIRDTETDVYLPEEPFLSQNFPNPFNPVTTIAFGLPTDQHVRIDIYDITGRLLTSLANGSYPAGTHQVRWNAANYASGVYLVRMQAEGSIQTRKMTLIK